MTTNFVHIFLFFTEIYKKILKIMNAYINSHIISGDRKIKIKNYDFYEISYEIL